jgi:hypothetical protein
MNPSEADILRRLQREQNRLVIVTANLSRIQRDLERMLTGQTERGKASKLTECSQDIIDTLTETHPKRLTFVALERAIQPKAIEARGHDWSNATLRRHLGKLTKQGIINNPRDGSGYGLCRSPTATPGQFVLYESDVLVITGDT